MSADASQEPATLVIREQIARIDNLLIGSQEKQREFHPAFWQVGAAMIGGSAALLAAGAGLAVAFFKLAGH